MYIFVFLFCLAIALASIWLSHSSINTYHTRFHQNYFYYLFNFYAFAFYGIWAQILMRALLSIMDSDKDVLIMAANFLPILGIPFLCISWIMLVRMGYSLVERPINKVMAWFHAIVVVGLVPLAWGLYVLFVRDDWLLGDQLAYAEMGLILFVELASMVLFCLPVLGHSKTYKKPKKKILHHFIFLMVMAFGLRAMLVPFLFSNTWFVAPILLFYFLSNFIPLFYLKLKSDTVFIPVYAEYPDAEKKAMLYKKYGITKREREIVNAICEGKTNQQIADELFISLQTVKDHTHRIYSKIGINSRMKLVRLLNKSGF